VYTSCPRSRDQFNKHWIKVIYSDNTYISGGQQCCKLAQRYNQIVEDVTHSIVSRDHRTFPETNYRELLHRHEAGKSATRKQHPMSIVSHMLDIHVQLTPHLLIILTWFHYHHLSLPQSFTLDIKPICSLHKLPLTLGLPFGLGLDTAYQPFWFNFFSLYSTDWLCMLD